MKRRFIIVGNGIAAINAIKAIREVDKEVEIILFGEEKFYPYNRLKLSKSLLDYLEEDNILLQKKDWYLSNAVNLHLDKKVTGINIDQQEIILQDSARMKYDKLLLANGARNFTPPIQGINKRGVFSLRNLDDARRIHDNIKNKNTIMSIGGGIQGLETAWILHQHNKKLIIAEIQKRLMPNQLDQRASEVLLNLVEKRGFTVLLDTQVNEIKGDENVSEVETKGGQRINCDAVIYSTGISPNIEILKDTPINTDRGVIVDEKMQTSVENVYAAGDVAEFGGYVSGLWNIAIGQGKTAGYNMVGNSTVYSHIVPVTTMNAYGISLFSMGDIKEDQYSQSITDEGVNGNFYRRIFIKNCTIVGAIVVGDTSKSPLLKSAIEKKLNLDGIGLNNITVDDLFTKIKDLK